MKLLIIAIICAHQSIVLSCQPIGVAICCNMIVIAIGNGHLQREISLQLQTAVLFVQKNKDLISCCAKSAKRIGRSIFLPSTFMSYPQRIVTDSAYFSFVNTQSLQYIATWQSTFMPKSIVHQVITYMSGIESLLRCGKQRITHNG